MTTDQAIAARAEFARSGYYTSVTLERSKAGDAYLVLTESNGDVWYWSDGIGFRCVKGPYAQNYRGTLA